MTTGKIYKFNSYENADNFRNRLTKTAIIILGDDNKYWVALGRDASRLLSQGYEAA